MVDQVSLDRGLFNNAHFLVARLAAPHFAPTLAKRYEDLSASLAPQIVDRVGDQKVQFIALLGSASMFRYYGDVDLVAGVTEHHIDSERLSLKVLDEGMVVEEKFVEIFYHEMKTIDPKDYIRYVFSKPILFGSAPNLFQDRLSELLTYAFDEALQVAAEKIGENDMRKGDHLLMAACRHAFSIVKNFDRPLPSSFEGVVRRLYDIDRGSTTDVTLLAAIKAQIEGWRTELRLADQQ